MTIQEAAKKWNVKEDTVFDYILKGYIYDLAIVDNEVVFPEIPKPYIAKKPKTVQAQDKYILSAMNKSYYVNAKIMGMSQEKFVERLIALIKANKIFQVNESSANFKSNLNFALVAEVTKPINISFNSNIDVSPNLEIKIADQIGVVNGKVG